MNKLFLAGTLVFMLILTISCGPNRDEAAEYNNNLLKHQKQIAEKVEALMIAFENYIPQEMDAAHTNLLKQINESVESVTSATELKGSEEFKKATLDLFNTYLSVAESEYREMIRIYKIPENEFTQDARNQWDELYKVSDDKIEKSLQNLVQVQKEFAEKYNLTIEAPTTTNN